MTAIFKPFSPFECKMTSLLNYVIPHPAFSFESSTFLLPFIFSFNFICWPCNKTNVEIYIETQKCHFLLRQSQKPQWFYAFSIMYCNNKFAFTQADNCTNNKLYCDLYFNLKCLWTLSKLGSENYTDSETICEEFDDPNSTVHTDDFEYLKSFRHFLVLNNVQVSI